MRLAREGDENRKRLRREWWRRALSVLMGFGVVLIIGDRGEAQGPASTSTEVPVPTQVEELSVPLFKKPRDDVPTGLPLTGMERASLQGVSRFSGGKKAPRTRFISLRSITVEQSLTADLLFDIPEKGVVDVSPVRISLEEERGTISINQARLDVPKREAGDKKPDVYNFSLQRGTQLLVVRPTLEDPLYAVGALLCLSVDYLALAGTGRLPAEENQLSLVLQQSTFGLTSVGEASFTSGVKPAAIRLDLDTGATLPPSQVSRDEVVGRDPTARLVYEPQGASPPISLTGEATSLEAVGRYTTTLQTWSGDQIVQKVANRLAIRRVASDEEMYEFLKKIVGRGRVKRPFECVFVTWERIEEGSHSYEPGSDLQQLIKRSGG